MYHGLFLGTLGTWAIIHGWDIVYLDPLVETVQVHKSFKASKPGMQKEKRQNKEQK